MTHLFFLWKIVLCGLTITTHLGGTTLSKDFSSSPWSSASSVRRPILSWEWFLINLRNNHQIGDGQLCDKTDTFLTAFLPCMTIVLKNYTTRVRRCKKRIRYSHKILPGQRVLLPHSVFVNRAQRSSSQLLGFLRKVRFGKMFIHIWA